MNKTNKKKLTRDPNSRDEDTANVALESDEVRDSAEAGKKITSDEPSKKSKGQPQDENGIQDDVQEESGQPEQEEIIDRLKKDLEVMRDSMLRKAAEFDNLKKRTQRERVVLYEDAKVDAVSKFLPIREDLKRSLDISRQRNVDSGFLEGLELVLNNFNRVLEQYGVEPIEETGVSFDVDKHDAMLSQPAPDESTGSNMVMQVLEPGYKIGDRVIRHAKVIVSQ